MSLHHPTRPTPRPTLHPSPAPPACTVSGLACCTSECCSALFRADVTHPMHVAARCAARRRCTSPPAPRLRANPRWALKRWALPMPTARCAWRGGGTMASPCSTRRTQRSAIRMESSSRESAAMRELIRRRAATPPLLPPASCPWDLTKRFYRGYVYEEHGITTCDARDWKRLCGGTEVCSDSLS